MSEQTDYSTYINSREWGLLRVQALQRSMVQPRFGAPRPACEACGQEGERHKKSRSDLDHKDRETRIEYSKGLEVHHLHYRNLGCEQPEDLIVLCTDSLHGFRRNSGCHERTHSDPRIRNAVEQIVHHRERGRRFRLTVTR